MVLAAPEIVHFPVLREIFASACFGPRPQAILRISFFLKMLKSGFSKIDVLQLFIFLKIDDFEVSLGHKVGLLHVRIMHYLATFDTLEL